MAAQRSSAGWGNAAIATSIPADDQASKLAEIEEEAYSRARARGPAFHTKQQTRKHTDQGSPALSASPVAAYLLAFVGERLAPRTCTGCGRGASLRARSSGESRSCFAERL
jgi:hypothetical protein